MKRSWRYFFAGESFCAYPAFSRLMDISIRLEQAMSGVEGRSYLDDNAMEYRLFCFE